MCALLRGSIIVAVAELLPAYRGRGCNGVFPPTIYASAWAAAPIS